MTHYSGFIDAFPAATMQRRLAAVPCGRYRGRQFYRFPVRVQLNDSQRLETATTLTFSVMAATAADAANWVRDQVATRPETEILAIGPKGGEVKRYVGWHSAIGAELFQPRGPAQLDLFPKE